MFDPLRFLSSIHGFPRVLSGRHISQSGERWHTGLVAWFGDDRVVYAQCDL